MNKDRFWSIVVVFIVLASLLIYMDVEGTEVLLAVVAIILCITQLVLPSDNPFET